MNASPINFVSIVLPTYNEAGNIVELCEAIHRCVAHPHEIIVVDDNSPDGTSALVRSLMAKGSVPGLRLETRLTDRGLTKSIWRGIELSQGDTIVWMDCDFSMPPEKIPELLAEVERGYDIAVGSRFVEGGSSKTGGKNWVGEEESRLVILLSRILNWVLRTALYPGFRDYTSGFVAARRTVFRRIRLTGFYGEYFMDFIYRAILLKFKVIEIPYVCLPRKAGVSKTGSSIGQIWTYGKNYLRVLLKMWDYRLRSAMGSDIADADALQS